jgi:hypothetical protein
MPTDKLKPTIELVNKSQMFTASHTPILKQQYKAQLIIEFIGGGGRNGGLEKGSMVINTRTPPNHFSC